MRDHQALDGEAEVVLGRRVGRISSTLSIQVDDHRGSTVCERKDT
jgi:hypothetical protein